MIPTSASSIPSVGVLSAMITPTILILAAASLIGATTNRLERIMEAMHELASSFNSHLEGEQDRHSLNAEQLSLMVQVERASKRARLMQYTVALLHVAITFFVLTQISLGLEAVTTLPLGLTPVGFGLVGAILLFVAIATLVRDAAIAVSATREEALFTLRMTELRAAQCRRTPQRLREPVCWS